MKKALEEVPYNKSGSCAIACILVNNNIYTLNVGDSRAFISESKGKKTIPLSKDHKPNDEDEKARIKRFGG